MKPINAQEFDLEDFVRQFHRTYPGRQPQFFTQGLTTDGKTSYEKLISVVCERTFPTVLDLGCGDGILLEYVSKLMPGSTKLIGVDMSGEELRLARQRMAESNAIFKEARAQDLPLADESVDLVLSHMALMVMDDIDSVVVEIDRVLKPGGVFSAVVSGNAQRTVSNDKFQALLEEALREAGVSSLFKFADPRTLNDEGLRSLFKDNFLEPIAMEDFSIRYRGKPEELAEICMILYSVNLLPTDRKELLKRDVVKAFELLGEKGDPLEFSVGLKWFTAKKKQDR